MARTFQRSPLALAVLALLYEAPMHPYRMQRLIKERGKDEVINVQRRASLYQTINQLLRAGLIAVRETSREEGRPERTVYALTEDGRRTALKWLREMLSTPAQEFPEFPAAISLLPLLTPEDALHQLTIREASLSERMVHLDSTLSGSGDLPRLFLLEAEYMRVVLEAELQWVRSLIVDLRSGEVAWNDEWLRRFVPPGAED
jgi:DNA-binding PadR family transcriptional regulator